MFLVDCLFVVLYMMEGLLKLLFQGIISNDACVSYKHFLLIMSKFKLLISFFFHLIYVLTQGALFVALRNIIYIVISLQFLFEIGSLAEYISKYQKSFLVIVYNVSIVSLADIKENVS